MLHTLDGKNRFPSAGEDLFIPFVSLLPDCLRLEAAEVNFSGSFVEAMSSGRAAIVGRGFSSSRTKMSLMSRMSKQRMVRDVVFCFFWFLRTTYQERTSMHSTVMVLQWSLRFRVQI